MAQLVLDIRGPGDRFRDDLAQGLPVALAEAMHGHLDGPFGHTETLANLRQGFRRPLAREEAFEGGEPRTASIAVVGLPQPPHGFLEHRDRPATVKQCVGGEAVGVFGLPAVVGLSGVEGDHRHTAAAFEALALLPLLGEKMLEGLEQKRTEPSPRRVRLPDVVLGQQFGEERLRQVGGGVRIVAASADVAVEGIPVGLAETREGLESSRTPAVLSGGEDLAPVRGDEAATRAWLGAGC